MSEIQRTISPVDGRVLVERPLATASEVGAVLDRARAAYPSWRRTPLAERVAVLTALVDAFVANKTLLAEEITWQMGRPVRYTGGEIGGFEARARTMLALAPEALADVVPGPKTGFERFVRREPVGLVLVLAPWNYPYLTAVNAVIPALAAGNVVVIKHSDQTPLCAERIVEAAVAAGLPAGVLQMVHTSHPTVGQIVADDRVDFVAFTGSVEGGRAVHKALGGTFKSMGLELGGKDPAYVRADAPFDFTVENVVDGAFFNSGQSCCAVERVYVHESLYDRFVDAAVALVEKYELGDPTVQSTTLGPMVRGRNADMVRAHVAEAVQRGAKALVDPKKFPAARNDGPYLAPQVLVDVDHSMAVMREETFGPVVGIMKVKGDAEAVARMNDSSFGLTASIWTADADVARAIGTDLETGTVFMNRCDALDPELAWVGVKHSGRGQTLSKLGYEPLTRPKSFHLRVELP